MIAGLLVASAISAVVAVASVLWDYAVSKRDYDVMFGAAFDTFDKAIKRSKRPSKEGWLEL